MPPPKINRPPQLIEAQPDRTPLPFSAARDGFISKFPTEEADFIQQIQYFTTIGVYMCERWRDQDDATSTQITAKDFAYPDAWDKCTANRIHEIEIKIQQNLENALADLSIRQIVSRLTSLYFNFSIALQGIKWILRGVWWTIKEAWKAVWAAFILMGVGVAIAELEPQLVKGVRKVVNDLLPEDTRPDEVATVTTGSSKRLVPSDHPTAKPAAQ